MLEPCPFCRAGTIVIDEYTQGPEMPKVYSLKHWCKRDVDSPSVCINIVGPDKGKVEAQWNIRTAEQKE